MCDKGEGHVGTRRRELESLQCAPYVRQCAACPHTPSPPTPAPPHPTPHPHTLLSAHTRHTPPLV
jgi:hypothetical protein